MKFNSSTASLSILAAFVTQAAALASCTCAQNGAGCDPNVVATGVPINEIPSYCGGLWDNLHRFGTSCTYAVTDASCGEENGNLVWTFGAPYCTAGMVESAWWEATKNKFGAIDC